MPLARRRRVRASGIELVTMPGIELLDVGEDWITSTGVFTFTVDDLLSAVDAMSDPAVRTPVLKFGHTDPRFDGDFSVGRVENLTIVNNGMTLVGDYVGVPKWLADIMASAYPRRSIEGFYDFETYTGNRWPFYLTAVALLGAQYPAVSTIEDIKEFWEGEPVEWVEVAASADPPYLFRTARGMMLRADRVEGSVPNWRKGGVEAAVEVDDIRREYYDSLDQHQLWWWIRAIQLDPPQLIVDDDEGDLYRVGYTISGDAITFSDPVKVKVEYVDVPAKAAASMGSWVGASTYPTRTVSRDATVSPRASQIPPEDDGMTPEQKKLIGLAEDASDEAVNAKLTELTKATIPADPGSPATPTPPVPDPDKKDEPEVPEPAPKPDVPEGMVLVDAVAFEQMKETTTAIAAKMATDEAGRQKGVVSAAIKDGRIPPARKEHYERLMSLDPTGTEEALGKLQAGTIPVTASVGHGDGDTIDGNPAEAYPSNWLPEVANGNGSTITQEA